MSQGTWRQARARQSSTRPLHLEVVSWWKSHGAVVVGAHSKCTQRRQLKWPSGEVAVCLLRMVPRQLDNLTEETWARILSQVDGNWLKSLGKCRSNTMCVCSSPFCKIRFRSANVWILCVAFYHSDSHPSMLASSSLSCKSIQIDPKWWQLETTNPSLRPSHGHQLIMRWTLAYAHRIVVRNTQFGQYCLHLVFGVWPATYITFGLCAKLWLSGPNQHSFISRDWQDTCSCTSTRRREWESQKGVARVGRSQFILPIAPVGKQVRIYTLTIFEFPRSPEIISAIFSLSEVSRRTRRKMNKP